MEIPGSQARLYVGRVGTGAFPGSFGIFRFRRANIRPRAPRIDGTNSEGLPGAVRGNTFTPGTALTPIVGGTTFPTFKEYPHESQLPGVGVCDIEIEQVTWDIDQIVYAVPAGGTFVNITPQRYYSAVIAPVWSRLTARDLYTFYSIYVEEARHSIDVKEAQPVNVTGYTNGPWTFPRGDAGSLAGLLFPATA